MSTENPVEVKNDIIKIGTHSKEANEMSLFMQLGMFLGWVIPFAGVVVPLMIWFTKR